MRPVLAVIVTALALFGVGACTSPGEPTRYRDLRVYPGFSSTTTLHPTASPVVMSFGIFNMDLVPLSGVGWQVVRRDALGNNPVTIQTGATDVAADTYAMVSVTDATLPASGAYAGDGVFIYTVTLDTANQVEELDETNNTATLTAICADLNLTWSVAPTVTLVGGQPVITGTILNTDITTTQPPAGATAKAVTVRVADEAGNLFSTILPNSAAFSPAAPQDLATGQSLPISITLPASEAGAGHLFTITIDPLNQIPESTKADNVVVVMPIGTI